MVSVNHVSETRDNICLVTLMVAKLFCQCKWGDTKLGSFVMCGAMVECVVGEKWYIYLPNLYVMNSNQ